MKMVPYEAFVYRCGAEDVVLRESYKPKTHEERVRLLNNSDGASSTPTYSPGPSTPASYSQEPATPQSYSSRPLRNAECSNYKHLLGKIKKIPACYDDDDDYNFGIIPNEPVDSLSMGNEHLNTILATESDEFIKSSVENLVPNPSETKGENGCDVPACFTTFSNILFDVDYDFYSVNDQSLSDEDFPKEIYSNPLFDEKIISMKINPHHFNVESGLIESMLNHDSSIISSSKIDSLFNEFAGELTVLKSIPPGISETDCDPKNEIRLTKRLLYDNSSPRPPEEFVSENSNADIESFSPSPILVEDNDSLMEEINLSFTPDDPMPPGVEEDDYDSERDIPILKEFLDNHSLSLLEMSHFILIFLHPLVLLQNHQMPSAECLMMIRGKNTPILDVPLIPGNLKTLAKGFYPPSLNFLSFNRESSVNPLIDHHCCYKCGNSLNDFFCHQCTCEFYGNGAHVGYNCPAKVPSFQTLPSFPQQYTCCEDSGVFLKLTIVNPRNIPMGNEHLNTILAMESDEFIKSSVENLVPNLSETKGENGCDVPACFTTFSNILFDVDYDFYSVNDQSLFDEDFPKEIYSNPLFDEEIISMKINPHHFNVESGLIESMLNHDSSIISSSKIDSLFDEFTGELTLLKSIPPGISETDCDPKNEIRLTKRLLYDNSSPRPPKEFVSENSNADIESFSPSPIPVEDNDSLMEEINLSFTPDDPMPSGVEEDDYDSERDIPILEELLDNHSLSLLEMSHFILIFLHPLVLLQNHQMFKYAGNWVKLIDLKQALRGRHPMLIRSLVF
nr:hypothetical protein [Tanacetum cinerariifolium]